MVSLMPVLKLGTPEPSPTPHLLLLWLPHGHLTGDSDPRAQEQGLAGPQQAGPEMLPSPSAVGQPFT